VIEAKSPGFEEAFLAFVLTKLLFQPDEFWDQIRPRSQAGEGSATAQFHLVLAVPLWQGSRNDRSD